MVIKKGTFYEKLNAEFPPKKDFLKKLSDELEKLLADGGRSTKESRNSEKLMNSYLYSYPDMVDCIENLIKRYERGFEEDGENSQNAVDDWSKKKSGLVGALFMPKLGYRNTESPGKFFKMSSARGHLFF